MARPKIEREANRDQIVRARFTAAEKKLLLDAAAKSAITPSDYIRVRTIGSQPQVRKATPDRALFIKGLSELGKVGSNVNQIARALNQSLKEGKPVSVPKDLIAAALQGVSALTNQLLKALDYDDGHSR